MGTETRMARTGIGAKAERMGVGEREPGNPTSNSGGGADDAREGVMLAGNQQPQSQDPAPQRERRMMRGTKAQRWEARGGLERVEEGRRKARNHARTGEARWVVGVKSVDERALVPHVPREAI